VDEWEGVDFNPDPDLEPMMMTFSVPLRLRAIAPLR